MRKLIFIFTLLFTLSIMATCILAEESNRYEDKAQQLNELGLFAGSDKGFELERAPKRVESAVMLIRLLGVEGEVKTGLFNHPFTDVPTWADSYIGYMYENGLTKGIGNNKFGSDDLTNAKSYATFVLRALGYDDSIGEFVWATAVETGVEKGILSSSERLRLQSDSFLRDDMVNISLNALSATLNGKELKLIDELISKGAVESDVAQKIGLLVDGTTAITDSEIEEVSFEGYTLIEVDGGNQSGHREAKVVVDIGFGERKYWAFTNEYGQLVRVIAQEIILQDESMEPVLSTGRYYSDEAKVPGVESPTLDEGHVIADSLGGVANAYNITPQESTLNRYGDQAYMERMIRDADGCTDFTAIITYPNTITQIPSHYSFTYTLKGNVIHDEFDNVNPDEVNALLDEEATSDPNPDSTLNNLEIISVGLSSEEVVIKNNSDKEIQLEKYTLVSTVGNQTYTFGNYTLAVGQTVTIYSGKGSGDLKWTGAYMWNNDGDTAELYDAQGNLLDQEQGK